MMMEILGILAVVLIIASHFVEGFTLVNMIQFFRGKETPLEKMTLTKQQRMMGKNKSSK